MSASVRLQKAISQTSFPMEGEYEITILPSRLSAMQVREGCEIETEYGTKLRLTSWAGFTEFMKGGEMTLASAPCVIGLHGHEQKGLLDGIYRGNKGSTMLFTVV